MPSFRELRYVRRPVGNLTEEGRFAGETFGLMAEDKSATEMMFRSDSRFYSLCLSSELPHAVGFSVNNASDLDAYAEHFRANGIPTRWIKGEDAERRIIKRGLSVAAPNGVHLEIVWRHMESGQPFHSSRHTGLSGFSAVQLASKNISEDAEFWRSIPGLSITDYVGEAVFLSLGDQHHHIAIYPSRHDGLLGAIWQVESMDDVMRHWHFMQDRQIPIAHGPGKQPTSKSTFVTVKTPEGFLMSYATEMGEIPQRGPRQFSNSSNSHCEWGSSTDLPEFKGEAI